MSVYRKLSEARIKLQQIKIKKSGRNTFASYNYMQLEDFLPPIQEIFHELNLIGVVSFSDVEATLTIVDVENPLDRIVIHSPMSEAALKGCHAVQNLGAVQTYLRRYLWVAALEIVEHDALDSSEPVTPEDAEQAVNTVKKPKPAEKKTVQGKDRDWQIKIEEIAGEWQNGMANATDFMLTFAESKDNVVKIFQTNRNLYDKLKEEHADIYADVMQLFTAAKAKFKE
jgi:hypothetical protein